VHIDDLLSFCFPRSEQHPASTGRLLVYGEFGPLDERGEIHCGLKGEHSLNKNEIETMARYIDASDLLYIYVGNSILSDEEEVEVIKQADPRLRGEKQLSRDQVVALFEDLDVDEDGCLSFHEVQQTTFRFREERIQRWKRMAANSVHKNVKLSKKELEERARHERALKIASHLVQQPEPKIDANDSFLQTSKLLHRHSFKICLMEEKNAPSLVQNVRILRNEASAAVKYGAVPWKNIG